MPIHKVMNQKIFIDGTPIEEYIDLNLYIETDFIEIPSNAALNFSYGIQKNSADITLKRGNLEIRDIPSCELEEDAIYIWGVFIALKPLEDWQKAYVARYNVMGNLHSRSRVFTRIHAQVYNEFFIEIQELKDTIQQQQTVIERLERRNRDLEKALEDDDSDYYRENDE